MRYLKHIHEMEEWATSNRIGDGYVYEVTPETVAYALSHGTPLRVKIKKGTRHYEGTSGNPIDVVGTIISNNGTDPDHVLRVMWDTGSRNSYDYRDLEIAIS